MLNRTQIPGVPARASARDPDRRHRRVTALATLTCLLSSPLAAETSVRGIVLDLNGRPLDQAMVSVRAASPHSGADVVTVFTGPDGGFSFPEPFVNDVDAAAATTVSALGYQPHQILSAAENSTAGLTILMRGTANQAETAPASAWLTGITDRQEKARFVRNCVDCHQVPSAEVRAYAKQIAEVREADPKVVREQSWAAMIQYMNFLSVEEFSRGREAGPPEASRAYSVREHAEIIDTLTTQFTDSMQELSGYDYGAPLLANENTVIREYEVPPPNAIREALLLGEPRQLWAADVSTNRMYAIDIATGSQRAVDVPYDGVVGPHSLHRGADGSLWVTPLFTSVIARLDPSTGQWRTWGMTTIKGDRIGVHDLSFGYEHELLTDEQGRIWYSDIRNNAVGWLDPETGDADIYRVPEVPGRPSAGAMLYGLIMTSDRKQVWYSQLGIGSFGSFNIETLEFGESVQLPLIDSGPRRLTISDDDVMYVPLYGSGQLVEYDTAAREQLGIYDLPDTGSAPYAVTWDPVRRVVWIPTANGNVIYRFDPEDKSFGVLPMPSQGAFMRMVDVDPQTGHLVGSYANIVDIVHGPRMAFIINPGDHAYEAP